MSEPLAEAVVDFKEVGFNALSRGIREIKKNLDEVSRSANQAGQKMGSMRSGGGAGGGTGRGGKTPFFDTGSALNRFAGPLAAVGAARSVFSQAQAVREDPSKSVFGGAFVKDLSAAATVSDGLKRTWESVAQSFGVLVGKAALFLGIVKDLSKERARTEKDQGDVARTAGMIAELQGIKARTRHFGDPNAEALVRFDELKGSGFKSAGERNAAEQIRDRMIAQKELEGKAKRFAEGAPLNQVGKGLEALGGFLGTSLNKLEEISRPAVEMAKKALEAQKTLDALKFEADTHGMTGAQRSVEQIKRQGGLPIQVQQAQEAADRIDRMDREKREREERERAAMEARREAMERDVEGMRDRVDADVPEARRATQFKGSADAFVDALQGSVLDRAADKQHREAQVARTAMVRGIQDTKEALMRFNDELKNGPILGG